MPGRPNWIFALLTFVGAVMVFAALGPADWQLRLGLHWLVEHFLAFFALTVLGCLAFPKPMRVAAVAIPVAVGLEAAQQLTPDRTPDFATALVAAAGVAAAALLADLFIVWRKHRKGG